MTERQKETRRVPDRDALVQAVIGATEQLKEYDRRDFVLLELAAKPFKALFGREGAPACEVSSTTVRHFPERAELQIQLGTPSAAIDEVMGALATLQGIKLDALNSTTRGYLSYHKGGRVGSVELGALVELPKKFEDERTRTVWIALSLYDYDAYDDMGMCYG